ncbi:hypothetical protein VTN31DRAFT_7111 [Thermomyces dupontii]|uniref:uncharacterized protein n=1 Tax=Talaromyces thermophilus TaxID=28565 RepID=UPI003742CC7C
MYTHRSTAPAPSPATLAQQQRVASQIAEFNRIHASQRKERIVMREQRHVAQCILQDPELLLVHALTSHESILQTRRRFTARFIAPDNPSLQDSLLHAHASSRSTTRRDPDSDPSLSWIDTLGAPRPRIEDVCELDDEKGWARYQAIKSKHHHHQQQQQRTPRKGDKDKDRDRARPKKRYKDDQSFSPSSAGARSPAALSRSASGNLRQGAGSPTVRASDTRRRWDPQEDDVFLDDNMEID